jgi:hypothetical protein
MDDEPQPEREVEDMERASDRLGREVDDTRSDWRSKQSDQRIPGAVEGDGEEGDEGESSADAQA